MKPLSHSTLLTPLPLRLHDLQDEVLDQLLAKLFPDPILRRRHITQPHPAFPFSLTCRRFHSLFRSRLHTIDALYPETYAPFPTCALGQLDPRHIAALIRLAAQHLRVLRLPRDCVDLYQALEQVAVLHIPLVELAYSNVHANVKERTERALFTHAASLQKLTVFAPNTVLKYIVYATSLRHLELIGVAPEFIPQLTELLAVIGPTLRILRVGFDNDNSMHIDPMYPVTYISTFALYICTNLALHLPRLHTLDVNSWRSDTVTHSSFAERNNASWLSDVSALQATVLAARERNVYAAPETALSQLSVRATFRHFNSVALDCLKAFDPIINGRVDVEVQIVGATVVFPTGEHKPYFKALQITRGDLGVALDDWGVACDKIEILDVGTVTISNLYVEEADFRDRIDGLVCRCTHSLKQICVEVELGNAPITRNVCIYAERLLERAINVERISFRTGFVDFSSVVCPEFKRLMSRLKNIRLLRLTNHPLMSAECKMAFGSNLPMFLHALTVFCPRLECLYLESAMPVRAASIASSEVREMAMVAHKCCMRAVEDLEATLPNCDVSTVRAQLQVWFRDINPPPPSTSPALRAVDDAIGRVRSFFSTIPLAYSTGLQDSVEAGLALPQIPHTNASASQTGSQPPDV